MELNNFLDFEQPIAELEAKIKELRMVSSDNGLDILEIIQKLEKKRDALIKDIYLDINPKLVVQIARHVQRPGFKDYLNRIFEDFDELHGDRHYHDDLAIIGGVARFHDQPIVILGQQKGKDTKEKIKRNFGMVHPEGYRKALRLMQLAEKFKMPVFTFIDTPGAYPGVGAEERNQSEAIARNLFEMSKLRTPIICTVIGEGCSGGALGIGVGDVTLMLQYSYYSVISPEGCASILWKSAEKAGDAAEAMVITAPKLKELGLIDEVVVEPLGSAHRDVEKMCATLSVSLLRWLEILQQKDMNKLLQRRYDRLMEIGR